MNNLKRAIVRVLPRPLADVLRALVVYGMRLGIWGRVIAEVRGDTPADELKLWGSFLAAPVTSLRHLKRWEDPIALSDMHVRARGIGRFHVRRGTDDLWHTLPSREAEITAMLRQSLKPGDVFVDAGANIGIYTVLAARLVGDKGRVYAVEMIDDTARTLRHHIELNGLGNVTVVENALSNRSGDIVEAVIPEGLWGQARISHEAPSGGMRRVGIKTVTLDEVLAREPFIRLIKMDLEGAEDAAVQGASDILPRTERIIFEARPTLENEGVGPVLESMGFKLRSLNRANMVGERL